MAGLRRELGVAPERKRPVLVADLNKIPVQMPETLLSKRDRAILLLGFTGAFRRSELVALDVEDRKESEEGMTIIVRRSKPIRKGRGERWGFRETGMKPVVR